MNGPIMPKRVSARTLRKLMDFFQTKAEDTGSREMRSSYKDIAEGSDISYAIVKDAIADLEDQGLLEVKIIGGRRTPNRYTYLGPIEGEPVPDPGYTEAQARRAEILEGRLAETEARLKIAEEELERFRDFEDRITAAIDSGRHYVLIVRKSRQGELGLTVPR